MPLCKRTTEGMERAYNCHNSDQNEGRAYRRSVKLCLLVGISTELICFGLIVELTSCLKATHLKLSKSDILGLCSFARAKAQYE